MEGSLAAGYHYSHGDAIIVLYSDLQDPPSVIPRFLEKWEEGYDVVYDVRTVRRGDPTWRNVMVKFFIGLFALWQRSIWPADMGDFRLIDRKVRDVLEQLGEYNRYMRGMIAWVGFKQVGITYQREARQTRASKGPFWHIVFFALNAITSFSMKPLRIFMFLGFAITVLSSLAILIHFTLYFTGDTVPGLTTLFILSFLGIGLNSIGIGIVGEYIGRIYGEVKHRPIYVIDEQVGFEL